MLILNTFYYIYIEISEFNPVQKHQTQTNLFLKTNGDKLIKLDMKIIN